jgi:hypothetical protein
VAYLDIYTPVLTSNAAAHLLRRATFGPTNQEVKDFTGLTATQAVDLLVSNASYRASPPPPRLTGLIKNTNLEKSYVLHKF